MDPISAIVSVIAAGATAALKETAGKAVKDTYEALRGFLASRLSSLAILEQNPKEEAFRKAAETEIRNKGLYKETALTDRIVALEKVLSSTSSKELTTWGIDISAIHAATDVIVKNLTTEDGSIRVTGLEARTGKVDIEGISAGAKPKN
jgi:hypothetical protein